MKVQNLDVVRFLFVVFCLSAVLGCQSGEAPRASAGLLRQALEQQLVAANGDSTLRFGSPNQNFGVEPTLRLQASGSNRALVRMDQAEIDAAVGGGTLLSATLRLPITSG